MLGMPVTAGDMVLVLPLIGYAMDRYVSTLAHARFKQLSQEDTVNWLYTDAHT